MSRYLIGIDLGTTNTVMAYADRKQDESIQIFEVEQLVALGEVAQRPQLPSLRYHPIPGELNPKDLTLPWSNEYPVGMPDAIVGSLAQELGTQVPGHLVVSAKSWLSHRSVDRTADILPWGAGEEVVKISPLTASASYLAHLRAAWNHRWPDHPLEKQEVVLTVPASFDEGARALTLQAAKLAGIPELRLLEEPQAAFYDWLHRHRDGLDAILAQTRLLLVCDVGGGTTDLSLIKVEREQDGSPQLTRIGVGDHLMLGGDNMDLGLAHLAEGRIAREGARLSAPQLAQLSQQCRNAKEHLLESDALDSVKVTVLGAGAKLIGGARSAELGRAEVIEMVLEGFFPRIGPDERPQRVRGGIVEFGLPYAADPAIPRHLAGFLAQHARVSAQALEVPVEQPGIPIPDTVLLNGGVFRSEALTNRLLETLGDWRGRPVQRLLNEHPEQAVARGAVAYALGRVGQAPRIGGGSARSYFLALEDDSEQHRAVCLLPRGAGEGQEVLLSERSFSLLVGQPVRFHLFSSTADTPWSAGELVELDPVTMLELPPIASVLGGKGSGAAQEIPVQLAASLTEVGTLEVECVAMTGKHQRWRLEFELRGQEEDSATAAVELPPRFSEAVELVERIYGRQKKSVEAGEVKRLRNQLERLLGPRDEWDSTVLRELFGVLWDAAGKRRRSADHERIWLNLAGYCARPGFGYPLDDWRMEQLWSLYQSGIQFGKEARNWAEWWILWRRVAGGLDETAQLSLFEDMAYYLQPPGMAKRPPGPKKQGYDDMVRLAASLERLPVERKIELGGWLLQRLRKSKENPQTWWAIGRLGAREPVYGSAHQVVPLGEVEQCLQRLLSQDWKKITHAAFAAALIARKTGDRERDLSDVLRRQVIERLTAVKAPASWVAMVREVVELSKSDEKRLLGDSLPVGLKLLR
ncbi:MAG: Hsp70 family protein [Pseudomonadota bacterium]